MNLHNIIKTAKFQTISGQGLLISIMEDYVKIDDAKTGEYFDWMSTDDFEYVVDAAYNEGDNLLTINW